MTSGELGTSRQSTVRRGILLSYATIGYNTLEAIGSLVAGVLAGSVALVGLGSTASSRLLPASQPSCDFVRMRICRDGRALRCERVES